MNMATRTLALALAALTAPAGAVDLESFIRKDSFETIEISPTGAYLAATIPFDDRTVLAILDRRDNNKLIGRFALGENTHVYDFDWISDERVLISVGEKFGALERPVPTGELYAMNADGTQPDLLTGFRVAGNGLGSKIQPKKAQEQVFTWLIDGLPNDDKNVLIGVSPWAREPFTRVERMDVNSGRRVAVARAPVRNARFATDNAGVVRFAVGSGTDNRSRLYYRDGEGAEWQLINSEEVSGFAQSPIGFSEDGKTAYLEAEQAAGPNAILAFDVATRTSKQVLRDAVSDPGRFIYRNGTRLPIGTVFENGAPRTAFMEPNAPEARLQRSLEAAFKGSAVDITSQTRDGKTALVYVHNDRNPGDFYLFDTEAKKAAHLLSRRDWFDPDRMASMQAVSLKARDGLDLHGLLTLPNGSNGKGLPMVVLPHGGPFGVQDTWGFDTETQLLAAAGYAVLQLNYRGSGGYGKAFEDAGSRQWGRTMQDDLTDATRWAIAQGIADRGRICLYGASYGAYASLMGVVKEPDLYRCAVGYVGVYDLPTMHTHGDIQQTSSGENYVEEWIGPRDQLGEVSPNRLASRIKVPVFLAAGGEDERTPIAHSEMMERALKAAGVPVETMYVSTEGHGFYKEANRREYYTRLLAFLARHLGGQTASAPAAKTASR